MSSPPASTPPVSSEQAGEGVRIVNGLWHHRGAVGGVASALLAAVATWYALTGRVETVAIRQVEHGAEMSAVKAAQNVLRDTHSNDMRDMRSYVDGRFAEAEKAQKAAEKEAQSAKAEAEKNIAVINSRLDTLDKAIGETRDNTRTLLDRVGDFGSGRGGPSGRR